MCIVVDTNCMSSVFKTSTSDHAEFKPVKEWILDGKGKIVIGGSKYLKEIRSYLPIIAELSKVNKVVKICSATIDQEHLNLDGKLKHKNYDDPHVIALLSISKCKVICSKDERAYPFFKQRELYISKKVPSIYHSSKQKHLLCDTNLIDKCLPCEKLKKEIRNKMNI